MSTLVGKKAEDTAAAYLQARGYKILEQNWRTRWCEIDIVASRKKAVYFVEVKYRKNPEWGSGLEYITSTKLEQMKFAAEFWVANKQWSGQYNLSAVAVAGLGYDVTDWIESVTL